MKPKIKRSDFHDSTSATWYTSRAMAFALPARRFAELSPLHKELLTELMRTNAKQAVTFAQINAERRAARAAAVHDEQRTEGRERTQLSAHAKNNFHE